MSTEIKQHRLVAFMYGFLCGVGLIMIMWGLASIAMLPSANLMMNIGLILFGVFLLAAGSCREAYLRGNLTVRSKAYTYMQHNRPEPANLISEQIIEKPIEAES